ncbi:MAG: ABC transporter ATP-binding protein [Phycisphaerales bacterium]
MAVIQQEQPKVITQASVQPADGSPASVRVRDVSFEYPLVGLKYKKKASEQSSRIGGAIHVHRKHVDIAAINGVSFDIPAGRRIGLCGNNGAGKSTLLRLIAGIYRPTKGSIEVYGKVASIFDRSLGMDLDLTGYENILIRGMFLGIERAQVKEKIDEIAAFCDLGDFLHLPIRIYSAGMRARLSFSICTAFDAEILILDEWLGVGDKQFVQKAQERMTKFFDNAGTVIIASHSEKIIKDNCHEFYQFERGQIVDHVIL